MEIEEYRKQFIDEIRNDASLEGSDPESYFIERVLTDLENIGELSDPIPMSVEIRNTRRQILAFDGYSYDEADGALVLIVSEFTNQRDVAPTLTNSRIEELLSYMQRFIDEAVNGNISNFCDDSDPAVNIANEFKKKMGKGMTATEILRFKFIIISNYTLSKQVKNLKRPDFLGRPVELNVWTLERFFQTFVSNSSEILEIETKISTNCVSSYNCTFTNPSAYFRNRCNCGVFRGCISGSSGYYCTLRKIYGRPQRIAASGTGYQQTDTITE